MIGEVSIRSSGGLILGGDGVGTNAEMPISQYSQDVRTPRDPSTSLSTGRKRQYAPVVFRKQWDAASPRLMQACSTNEELPSVTFIFFSHGTTTVDTVVHLTGAVCVSMEHSDDGDAY